MTKVAIYARFSTTMQREASIEDQVRLCTERAAQEGFEVVETYVDMAISGASLNRSGLARLIEEAGRGRFKLVLTEALDRLSRDQADIAMLYKQLSFYGVEVITLAEGAISELHVGLKGTMNQLFLKDLAAKTRRGLRGRVEAGLSGGGNAFGYDVVRRLGEDGLPVTGERRINEQEAQIVRRIFRAYSEGQSPKGIAKALNAEGLPGPRGMIWRDTAIRGHRSRGTGILNNELYVGRLVWNRMRYVKDPSSGKRVSRINPQSEWIVTEVPDLRLIDDRLWSSVKSRQVEIDATPAVQGIKASRFWEKRRKAHLLTGLLHCGSCGGAYAAVGRDYLACSNARKLGTCDQRRSRRRSGLEASVLNLLQDRLMQADAVAAFVTAYTEEVNRQRGGDVQRRKSVEEDLRQTERKLAGLYDAIADGLRTPGLLRQLQDLEARKVDLESRAKAPAPSPVRLHPALSDVYRARVTDLANSLSDPTIQGRAIQTLRGLIRQVTVREDPENGQTVLELEGAIAAMIEEAQPSSKGAVDLGTVKVVAGTGFEPVTFRL